MSGFEPTRFPRCAPAKIANRNAVAEPAMIEISVYSANVLRFVSQRDAQRIGIVSRLSDCGLPRCLAIQTGVPLPANKFGQGVAEIGCWIGAGGNNRAWASIGLGHRPREIPRSKRGFVTCNKSSAVRNHFVGDRCSRCNLIAELIEHEQTVWLVRNSRTAARPSTPVSVSDCSERRAPAYRGQYSLCMFHIRPAARLIVGG